MPPVVMRPHTVNPPVLQHSAQEMCRWSSSRLCSTPWLLGWSLQVTRPSSQYQEPTALRWSCTSSVLPLLPSALSILTTWHPWLSMWNSPSPTPCSLDPSRAYKTPSADASWHILLSKATASEPCRTKHVCLDSYYVSFFKFFFPYAIFPIANTTVSCCTNYNKPQISIIKKRTTIIKTYSPKGCQLLV